ncbi:MAG: ATPase, T2SS/T4P/T4SS family [Alphaproteobacteria bacterium]
MLRQNPDILMIGEIRDAETAEIAVQAALTGTPRPLDAAHNRRASSVTRLVDMGVPGYLVAHTVVGILAQRLVKRICPECRVGEPMMPELAQRLRITGNARLFKAKGCAACHDRGTSGRTPIAEAMQVTPGIRRQILARADAKETWRSPKAWSAWPTMACARRLRAR